MKWSTSKTVNKFAHLNLSGNIIPPLWYKNIRYMNGKAHLAAIIILADIVYWYRPRQIRDEETGKVIGYEKKFSGEKLQRSRESFAKQFYLTKKQVKDAIDFLCDKCLITKEVKKRVEIKSGVTLGNVLYLEPVYENVYLNTFREILPSDFQVTGSDLQVTPSIPTSHTLYPYKSDIYKDYNIKTSTNTKNKEFEKESNSCPDCKNEFKKNESDNYYCSHCNNEYDKNFKNISVPSAPDASPPAKTSDSRIPAIQKYFTENHPNGEYVISNYSKWGAQIKVLLKSMELAGYNGAAEIEIKKRCDQFFTSDRNWHVDSGYSFDVFLKDINALKKKPKITKITKSGF